MLSFWQCTLIRLSFPRLFTAAASHLHYTVHHCLLLWYLCQTFLLHSRRDRLSNSAWGLILYKHLSDLHRLPYILHHIPTLYVTWVFKLKLIVNLKINMLPLTLIWFHYLLTSVEHKRRMFTLFFSMHWKWMVTEAVKKQQHQKYVLLLLCFKSL